MVTYYNWEKSHVTTKSVIFNALYFPGGDDDYIVGDVEKAEIS
jgi:hypothetical protein